MALKKKIPFIRPIAEIDLPRSWAVYGRSGTGKTTFAASFPKPMLLVDVQDKGTDSIRDVKGIDVATLDDWDQLEDVYDVLTAPKCKYQSVVFDTMTQLQLLCANWVRKRQRKPMLDSLRWGDLSMRDWGDVGAALKQKITEFRNLDMEVAFIAQERSFNFEEVEGTENMLQPEVGAALSPATAQHLNASVTVVVNTFIKVKRSSRGEGKKRIETVSTIHSMRIGPNPVFTTKVRKPKSVVLPDVIDNPTHKLVVDIMEGRE